MYRAEQTEKHAKHSVIRNDMFIKLPGSKVNHCEQSSNSSLIESDPYLVSLYIQQMVRFHSKFCSHNQKL